MELFDRSGKPIRHARDIRYDNLVSGLSATDLQAAIDELAAGSASYTDEDAQDAVGNILTNSATIEFTYNDSTPSITADLSAEVLNLLDLADSAVQPGDLAEVAFSGDYGDLSNTPSIPSAANPSASVGLTAVNGAASTFMRSDAAPPLDQSIDPTWTGRHRFNGQVAISDGTLSDPSIAFAADTDTGMYRIGEDSLGFASGGELMLRLSNSAGILHTTFVGAFRLNTVVSETLGSNQDNYAPTGIDSASFLRLTATTNVSITGMQRIQFIGRLLMLLNVGSANSITLVNESASSDPGNRFAIGANVVIGPGKGVMLTSDATSLRWRIVGAYL